MEFLAGTEPNSVPNFTGTAIKLNNNRSSHFFAELMKFYSKFHRTLYETNESPLHDPCVVGYLLNPDLFSGKEVNVTVEENSELTMGKTVVDWLSVTGKKPNCLVIDDVDSKAFFKLLKEKISLLP